MRLPRFTNFFQKLGQSLDSLVSRRNCDWMWVDNAKLNTNFYVACKYFERISSDLEFRTELLSALEFILISAKLPIDLGLELNPFELARNGLEGKIDQSELDDKIGNIGGKPRMWIPRMDPEDPLAERIGLGRTIASLGFVDEPVSERANLLDYVFTALGRENSSVRIRKLLIRYVRQVYDRGVQKDLMELDI